MIQRTMAAPWLGAAYYPEDWPEELQPEDIRLMQEMGLNVMRVGEFAWSRMEPREGEYDFGWLHRVVERLHAAGIATVLCTPSATPPAWLTAKHPDMLVLRSDGQRQQHGARRHCCSNNPAYREATARIVKQLAREFAGKPGVIGWQLDNEIHRQERGCFCPVCEAKFRARLQARFETVEEMNRTWGLGLWSMDYTSFDEVPAPRAHVFHHPSLTAEWLHFQSDSNAEFLDMQADLLRAGGVDVPIGTDMMPTNGQHYPHTNRQMDVVQYNHYDDDSHLWAAVFWMDYIRNLKPRPFWNTETSTCWNGGVTIQGYREPGFCRANSWLPFALGGEMNCYWLWRAHWAGQELMHGSVVSSCGRPLHIADEVREVAEGLERARDFLTDTACARSGLAMHFSAQAWDTFQAQPMVPRLASPIGGRPYAYASTLNDEIYRALIEAQLRPDIIDPAADLTNYRLVYSPFLPCIEEGNLSRRLPDWLEQGGVWVAGPLTDVRTPEGTKYTHAPFGHLESLAGIYCKYELPGHPKDFRIRWWNGEESAGGYIYDGLECREGCQSLGTYLEAPMAGLAAAAWQPIGSGGILILGTQPPANVLVSLLRWAGEKVGVRPVAQADANLLVVPRRGPRAEGWVCVELHNRPARLVLGRPVVDLLTGERLEGKITVAPFGVRVLQAAER
ncbi:MAG: beta-galactosidase [Chloroflexi bacterium]|nr:beta-galactosidase [Chloroflexota bacterium]